MDEIRSIQIQLEKINYLVSQRIQKIYCALEELKNITMVFLELTPNDTNMINAWIQDEKFVENEQGYFLSRKRKNEFLNKTLCEDAITYHWPAIHKDNFILRHRFFALRNLGKTLKRIKQGLDDITIIYYQDIEFSACFAYPFFDMPSTIPSNFNWNDYLSCQSVKSENNPECSIKWSIPSIDYAGEGLISIVSIPIYHDELMKGLWSIDMPHQALHKNIILENALPEQINFIADFKGKIIAHPEIKINIDKEKGSFYQLSLETMGECFKDINLMELISNIKGVIDVTDNQGRENFLVYQTIEEIEWVVFSIFPKEQMFKSTQQRVVRAFESIKNNKQLSHTIDFQIDNVNSDMRILIDSYNDMIKMLDFRQKEQNRAKEEAYEAQRILNEELENKVNERTNELEKLNHKLKRLANTDSLTGIFNRRRFFELTEYALRILVRKGDLACLLIMDIDYFKNVNDNYGHDVGDETLQQFVKLTISIIRNSDVFARYGGEEFILFLPATELSGAIALAEKIRSTVKKYDQGKARFTISIGVSEVHGINIENAIKQADSALYQAKNNGRNRVECWNNKTNE